MFGGQVIAPTSSKSPHLRKPGSRLAISDIVNEQGNGLDDSLSPSSNSIGTMNVSSTLATAVIMPSPVLLWRLKVLLFFSWGFVCCKVGWDSVMRMSMDLRDLFLYEAFLYYNPLFLMTMMVWLWGVNLWVFSQSTVSYVKIFDLDQNHLTHREMWKIATWMTIVVPTSMTAYLCLYSHGEVSLAASQPVACVVVSTDIDAISQLPQLTLLVLLYCAVAMVLIFPFDIFYLSSRYYFLRTIWRIILPLQAITFSDFFLADILTSMSKVFSDLERSVCRMVHQQVATIAWFEADSVCGSHSVAIPLALVLPYIFRLFQCLKQYKDYRERAFIFNALKYSTAIPVIFLSALKYHVFPNRWSNFYRPLWLVSGVVNSLYSFYWDVTRDWDLSGFTRIFKFNRPSFFTHLFYGRTWALWIGAFQGQYALLVSQNEWNLKRLSPGWFGCSFLQVYLWVIGSNLILRCAWTYKLSAHLRHNYLTVFAIAALEMIRRFQWIFFRVENEWNKMTTSFKSGGIPLSATVGDRSGEDKLLLPAPPVTDRLK